MGWGQDGMGWDGTGTERDGRDELTDEQTVKNAFHH